MMPEWPPQGENPAVAPAPGTSSDVVDGSAPPRELVIRSRACVGCGYDLLGLPTTGRCPECGTSVAQSLHGYLLRFADERYLKIVRQGLSLTIAGIVAFALLMVVSLAVGFSAPLRSTLGGAAGVLSLDVVLSLAELIPSALLLIGYWRFTEPDPGYQGTETPTAARRVIRVTVIIQAAAALAGVGFSAVGVKGSAFGLTGLPAGPALAAGLAMAFALAGTVAWCVQFFAVMNYVAWLGRRVPDSSMVRQTRTYMWLLPLVYVFGACILMLGPIIALTLYLVMLIQLRGHLTQAAERPAGVAPPVG